MAVTITKKFWNSTDSRFDNISKIVFTSPNISSPAFVGTRSHILPDSSYIGTWYESSTYMYVVNSDQNGPLNEQETYFNRAYVDQDSFNFNTDNTIIIGSDYTISGSNGHIFQKDQDSYAIVDSFVSTNPEADLRTSHGSFDDDSVLNGSICISGNYIYQIRNNSKWLYVYDITTNTWIKLENAPSIIDKQGSLCRSGDRLYIVKGNDNVFWEYEISTDNWIRLADIPYSITSYGYSATANFGDEWVYLLTNKLPYVPATNKYTAYKFKITDNTWHVWFEHSSLYNYSLNIWEQNSNIIVAYYDIELGVSTSVDIKLIDTTSPTVVKYTKNVSAGNAFDKFYVSAANIDSKDKLLLSYRYEANNVDVNKFIPIKASTWIEDALPEDSGWPSFSSTTLASFEGIDADSDYISPFVISNDDSFYMVLKDRTSEGWLYKYTPTTSGGSSDHTYKTYLSSECGIQFLGSNILYLDGYIYTSEGKYSSDFWKYNISSTVWSRLKEFPVTANSLDRFFTVHEHDVMETDGTDVYKFRGHESNNFYKHNVSLNTWTTLSGSPGLSKPYANMTYVSGTNDIYVIQGEDSRAVWRYNTTSGIWYDDVEDLPEGCSDSCSIHYPRTGGDYIYCIRGKDYNDFWKYSVVSGTWSDAGDLEAYDDLVWGLSSSNDNKLYSANASVLYEYCLVSGTWSIKTLGLDYSDSYKRLESDGENIYLFGDDGLYKYDLSVLSTNGAYNYRYNVEFSSVVGTETINRDDNLYVWQDNLNPSLPWSHIKNSVVFEVTLGEAYDCKLTAWDDDTHSTTNNKVLDEGHYKVSCAAMKAGKGTKEEPYSDNITDSMVHPPGIDIILKGNTSYYGTFDLINVVNAGTEHGNYLIFVPRLDEIDGSFTSGNYDFVTTLHYQYT